MKVALLGYGAAGAVLHAPLISATAGLELAAIVTRDRARHVAARRAYPTTAVHPDPAAIWGGGFDLVVIATASGSHVELARKAIEAGVAVVVDKPLATSSRAAAEVVRLARDRGVPLTVFQNRRWDSDFRTVQRILSEGRLGRVHRLESRFELYREMDPRAWQESADPIDGGGVLIDLGSHLIDQALVLFGRPISVFAEIHRRRPGAVIDDDVFVSLAFPDDITCHLWMSRVAHASGPGFRLIGSDAAFEIDDTDPQWGALERGERPGGPSWGRHPTMGHLLSEAVDGPAVRRVRPVAGAYHEFYERVRDALLTGGPMPVDPQDAIDVLRVIEASRSSAERGRVIAFDGLATGRPARS